MQIKKIAVFTYAELSDSAKSRAKANFCEGYEYPHFSDAVASITAFVEHFGGRVLDYIIGAEAHRAYVKTSIGAGSFRGVKLRDIDHSQMPTGYYLDCTLWGTMKEEFSKTGDAYYAFQQAIESVLHDIATDVEYQYSDEYVEEMMDINDYQFTEDGETVHFGFLEEAA